jgi:large repetitive protein
VAFNPKRPGPRYGAVELLDGSGNLLATGYVQGTGVGPLVTFANTTSGVYLPSAQTTLGSGFYLSPAVAVDGSGNVFVADSNNDAVKEIVAAGGYTTVNTLGSGFSVPVGVALDGNGNVFVADSGSSLVKEIVAAGGYTTIRTLGSGFIAPFGVAVDGSGNVFVADTNHSAVERLDYADAPSLSFAATAVGSASSDSPQSVTIENIGNQSLNAMTPGLTIGTNFAQVAGTGTPADCTSSFALAPGATCNLSISFTPVTSGPLQSAAVLTDNSLNGNPTTQSIPLSGTGTAPLAGVSPGTLSFGKQLQGSTSAAKTVTLSNTGVADLAISSIATTGNFAQTNTCGSSLAAGGNCAISVSFTPQSSGAVTGTLTIIDNSGGTAGSTQIVSLSGTGTNFTITANPASATIPIAHTATFTLTLTPTSGFTGPVSLACSGGPAASRCSISPVSLPLNGSSSATAQVTITFVRSSDTKGTFTFTLTGTSGTLSHQTHVSVTVKT